MAVSRGRKKLTDDVIRRMREMRRSGCTYAAIADAFEVSDGTVMNYLHDMRHDVRIPLEKILRMKPMRESGMSLAKIGAALGVSDSSVDYWLKKMEREAGCTDSTAADHLREDAKMVSSSRNQLCWRCARSAAGKDGQCSWDARLQPVEGWTVDKDGFVVSCPEFEEARR